MFTATAESIGSAMAADGTVGERRAAGPAGSLDTSRETSQAKTFSRRVIKISDYNFSKGGKSNCFCLDPELELLLVSRIPRHCRAGRGGTGRGTPDGSH